MPALKMLMMDECHPAGKGRGLGGGGGGREKGRGGEGVEGIRPWGAREEEMLAPVDVCTDPRPWAVIHGEKRELRSCLLAPPLSVRWIEILLLLAALLPTAQAQTQTYIFVYAQVNYIGSITDACVNVCICVYIYTNTLTHMHKHKFPPRHFIKGCCCPHLSLYIIFHPQTTSTTRL